MVRNQKKNKNQNIIYSLIGIILFLFYKISFCKPKPLQNDIDNESDNDKQIPILTKPLVENPAKGKVYIDPEFHERKFDQDIEHLEDI